MAAGWCLPVQAQAQVQDGAQSFDIPAQDARRALVDLCVAAGCEVAFVTPPGRMARSHAVQGRMSWRAAVARMLEDTGLSYRFVGARGVRVWAEARPAAVAETAADPAELESIVVIGRLSEQIEESLRRKREADVISDSASSTRIGELPAANLAEALQRVPGVAIEREVGEGQFVSVRGLGPLFQSVTLNGAPVAFNENIRNSTQSGRQFRFRALSADLLAGAQLTKSATPDLIEGGIGSNIDIETIGGLDGDPFLSLRVGAATEARARDPRLDLSVAGRVVADDGAWGLVGGLSQEGRSVVYDRFQTGRYLPVTIDGRTVLAPGDLRTTVEREDRLRRSLFLGGEWQAAPAVRLRFDSLVSTFDNTIREDRLAYGLGPRLEGAGATVRVQDGVVTAGTVSAGRVDNNTEFSEQNHLNFVVSGGADLALGLWTATPRVSISRARSRLDTPLQRISFHSRLPVAYRFDQHDAASTRTATLLETDLDVGDPSAIELQRFGVRAIDSVDDDRTALVDLRRGLDVDVGGVSMFEVRFGAQFSDRGRDYQRRDREAELRPGAVVIPFHGAWVPAGVFDPLIDRHPGAWIVADFDAFQTAFVIPGEVDGVRVTPDDLTPTGADRQNSYEVGERVGAVYGRVDFEGAVGAAPFFGNAGLRLVRTRTTVRGAMLGIDAAGAADIRDVAYAGWDTRLLPSANIAFDLDDHRRLRLAASRTLTRPSLADLRLATAPASSLVSAIYDRGQAEIDDPSPGALFSGVGGNPALRPYVSTNLDASYEWSFPRGALSLAVFHKSIDDFIGLVAAPETLVFETRAGPLVRAEVLMSRPANLGRAVSQGVELGLHRRFPSGFGLWASATLTDGHGADGRTPLAGVSRLAYSINPFVERGPVSAGLSWSWRSAFRSEADMQGGGVSDFTVGAAGYLDAQATIDVGANGQLVIAASNLTDTTDLAYEHDTRRLLQLGRVGRSLTVGFRWRLP
ncbi:TonB-dependent receptor [Brevundimonas sp.]|jgi:iron complex outermembrane receptor protein|uniref:TonB-dependent receptor n=1 Tax=Brevundimonas sp. TaxID=1871086 RepID=UPI0037C07F8B